MKFYSTNNLNKQVSLKEALVKGIAEDGGLYMPVTIPKFEQDFFLQMPRLSFKEISYRVANSFLSDEFKDNQIQDVIDTAFTFNAPVVSLDKYKSILELFHGPTLAFKDFGARFMAALFSILIEERNDALTILVATSGDTGSAVANAFLDIEGIRIILLYPSGKISDIQEKQLTTLKGNVTVLEIDGVFDDCQQLVKQAFADNFLQNHLKLTSANSINIARLLPQSFYYFSAAAQLDSINNHIAFVVPSGNFGNLTGGLLAREMGLPINYFIAATNVNDIVPHYLKTGIFTSKPSIKTLSNAMDVGNPSNFKRILSLFHDNYDRIKTIIKGASFNDEETLYGIKDVYEKYNYIIDPHGAVGYLAAEAMPNENMHYIILETAHPAKFIDIVEPVIKKKIEIPQRLQQYLQKEKKSVKLPAEFNTFKEFLIDTKGK